MTELRLALNKMYEKFGLTDETLMLSQILDELVVEKQREKYENKKDLDREIEADARLKLGVMELLPSFDNLITIYEIKWNKLRNDFNVIERDLVIKEFHKLYGKKVNKLLMGEK